MKRLLYLTLISMPIFSMQPEKDNKLTPVQSGWLQRQNTRDIALTTTFVLATNPTVRNAAITVVIAAANTVPYIAPVAVVAGIGMRIVIAEDKDNKK